MKIVCLQYFFYLFLASSALDNDSNTTLDEDSATQYFHQQKEQNIENTTQFQISENWTLTAVHNITGKTFTLAAVDGTNSSALVEHEEVDEVTESKPDLKPLHKQFTKNKGESKKDEISEEHKRIRINSNASKDNFLKQTGKKKKLPNIYYLRNGSKLELDKKAPKVRVYPSCFKDALMKRHHERNLSLTHNESLAEDNIHKISHKVISNEMLESDCPCVLLSKIQALKSNIEQIYRTISTERMHGLLLKQYWPLIFLYISSITQFTASYFVTLTMLKISGCILKMFN